MTDVWDHEAVASRSLILRAGGGRRTMARILLLDQWTIPNTIQTSRLFLSLTIKSKLAVVFVGFKIINLVCYL